MAAKRDTSSEAAAAAASDAAMATPAAARDSGAPEVPAAVAGPGEAHRRRVSTDLSRAFGIDESELYRIIRDNVINTGRNEPPATKEEVFAVMTVMSKYQLDPWVKQVHAFRHKGRLNVMVGYDGWVALANRQHGFQGVTYRYSDKRIPSPDGKGKPSWEWIEATCHVEGRAPVSIFCYFDEWYVPVTPTGGPGPWQKQSSHRHRQKAYTMVVREAFGIGLMDETDSEQLRYADAAVVTETANRENTMLKRLSPGGTAAADAKVEAVASTAPEPEPGQDNVDAMVDSLFNDEDDARR